MKPAIPDVKNPKQDAIVGSAKLLVAVKRLWITCQKVILFRRDLHWAVKQNAARSSTGMAETGLDSERLIRRHQ